MSAHRYGAICPIAHACKILEPRWTIPILTELWAGSSRFNDIRRGVGNISPGLLARRLRELEELGMVRRVEDEAAHTVDYYRTEKAIRLEPALNALGEWAQQNISAEIALSETDVRALMFKLRRDIKAEQFGGRRVVIQFTFDDAHLERNTYWLVFYPSGERDLCVSPPRREVDLFIETNLVSFGSILTGRSTLARETEEGETFVAGDPTLAKTVNDWLPFSLYLDVGGVVQLKPRPPATPAAAPRKNRHLQNFG